MEQNLSKKFNFKKLSLLLASVTLPFALLGNVAAQAQQGQAQNNNQPPVQSTETQVTDKDDPISSDSPIKIGYVAVNVVLNDSKPAVEAQKKIDDEFGKREEDIQKLANDLRSKYEDFDKNAPVMTDSDRSKVQRELTDLDTDLQRKRREFQEDLNRRRNDAFASLIDKIDSTIKNIAESEDYDLILSDGAVTVSKRIDITDKVIEALDKK